VNAHAKELCRAIVVKSGKWRHCPNAATWRWRDGYGNERYYCAEHREKIKDKCPEGWDKIA
jgi:hypothetical protein